MTASDYIRWLGELGAVASVGGKTALLGELCSALSQDGMKVPEGSPSPPKPIATRWPPPGLGLPCTSSSTD